MIKKRLDMIKQRIAYLELKRNIKDGVFIALGVFMAAVGLKGFLLPNNFLDGGVTGISLLLKLLTSINLSYLIVLINLPFLILGVKQISLKFAIKSIIAIVSLAVVVNFISFPIVTTDKLLIAIFGGAFLGAGIGLTIRGGAVIDGTEILAISISRNNVLSVGDFIAIFNVLLFVVAIFLVGVEIAMYSILTYLSASKIVDFIINGIEEHIGVFIISKKSEHIQKQIIYELGYGVTVLNAIDGFGSTGHANKDTKVLFCVVTRLEVTKLILEIEKIDPNAFFVQQKVKDIKGGKIKKKPFH